MVIIEEIDDDSWELLEKADAETASTRDGCRNTPAVQQRSPLVDAPSPTPAVSSTPEQANAQGKSQREAQDCVYDAVETQDYQSGSDSDEYHSMCSDEEYGEGVRPGSNPHGDTKASTPVIPEASDHGASSSCADRDVLVEQSEDESEEVKQEKLNAAEQLKKKGNDLYLAGLYEEALEKYTEAMQTAPVGCRERAVYVCNRAACSLQLRDFANTVRDCSEAITLDETYVKAWLRRCAGYEGLDDLERALADATKVLELEPTNSTAQSTVQRLTPKVEERREKMKEEVVGKLKDLGNSILGRFGLSVDNFKAEKDPSTGSYSIKFER